MKLKEFISKLQEIKNRDEYEVMIEHTGGLQDNPPTAYVYDIEIGDDEGWNRINLLC